MAASLNRINIISLISLSIIIIIIIKLNIIFIINFFNNRSLILKFINVKLYSLLNINNNYNSVTVGPRGYCGSVYLLRKREEVSTDGN